jgi:asparagine N-glycosylation enzyme membrane subunit Stt3
MSVSWREAIGYLKTQTPPTLDYGVISWWDYGYWIARESKRPVPCHPGGGRTDLVAKFFVSQNTEEASTYAVKLKSDYIVIDYQMAKQKFYAIPILAEAKNFDDSKYNDCMLARLYYSKAGIEGYRMVFESSEKYEGEAQVKIYKRYDIATGCDCGK